MKKAIVIDDSSTVRSIISKMLTAMGIQSVQAADGKQALTVLSQNEDVSIAFVDWNMPVMNGIDFVQEVRKQAVYNKIKILMVTTETEMSQVVIAIESGVDEYIMKPFTKEIFLEKLSMLGILDETGRIQE